MPINVYASVDTSGLRRGLAAASVYTKRSMADVINTSCYWIAVNAKNRTPRASPQEIGETLGVAVTARIGKRGTPLSMKSSKGRMYIGGKTMEVTHNGKTKMVPVAALIVAARANPESNANKRTGYRWLIPGGNPFKTGKGGAALGRARMKELVHKMIAARQFSSKFLMAGWVQAVQKLKPYAKKKYIKGFDAPSKDNNAYRGANLGDAVAAINSGVCRAAIENNIGYEGKNRKANDEGLNKQGRKALQDAVDIEGRVNIEYALKKVAEELKKETDKHFR